MTVEQTWITVLVKSAERVTQDAKSRACIRNDLNNTQFSALYHLHREAGLSSAELARRCYATPQAMVEVVTRLLAADLVNQQPSPHSRRALALSLTEKGEQVYKETAEELQLLDGRIRGALGEEQADQLERLLAIVSRTAENYSPN